MTDTMTLTPNAPSAMEGSLHRWMARRAAARAVADRGRSASERVESAIARASFRSAALGVASGMVSTAAAALVVETGGVGALVAVPAAALAATGEVLARAMVHAEMITTIADAMGVDPATLDVASLASRPAPDDGHRLLHTMLRRGGHEALECARGAAKTQGSMALRSLVPVVGVVSSAWWSWREARELGRSVHDALK